MSRRVKLATQEKGDMEILLVWSRDGVWEPDFEPLRGTPWASLLTVVPPDVIEHALRGWSKPLMSSLGIPPAGALRKLPVVSKECSAKNACAIHDPTKCFPASPDLPLCFEPGGLGSEQKMAAARVVQAWHEGVYVVVTHG